MNKNAGLLGAWAYLAIIVTLIGAVSGLAAWYKGVVDDGWRAELEKQATAIRKEEADARAEIADNLIKSEKRHAEAERKLAALSGSFHDQCIPDDALRLFNGGSRFTGTCKDGRTSAPGNPGADRARP